MKKTSWEKVLVPGTGSKMYELAKVGPAEVIVWEAVGGMYCSAYLPVGSKLGGPDGKTLVGGTYGTNYGAVTLATAKKKAIKATKAALSELGLMKPPPAPAKDPNYGAPWA